MAGFVRVFAAVGLLALGFLGPSGCKRHAVESDTHAEAKQLFDSICGRCHGSDGRGGVPSAEGQPAPRNFCDAAFQADRSDADLKNVILHGKGPMPPFAALFDDSQATLLVAYVRSFNPKKSP
jgi:mono/diheme cytochrome c family protein